MFHNAEIIAISYERYTGRAVVRVQGHLTDAVTRAHRIIEGIYGPTNKQWRIISCIYHPPAWNQLASTGWVEMKAQSK